MLTVAASEQISAFPVALTGNLATLFSKASILLFYLRFSTSRLFNVAIYILLFIIAVANSLGALGVLFYCQPISFFWELTGSGSCISGDHWYAWLAILNCVTDGILLVLPAWIIYPLRVGLAQKTAIAAILGTGGLYVLPPSFPHLPYVLCRFSRAANHLMQRPRREHLSHGHHRAGLG